MAITSAYDADGNLIDTSSSDGSTTDSALYNADGEATSTTTTFAGLSQPIVQDYAYDADGDRTVLAVELGLGTPGVTAGTKADLVNTYAYNALGQTTQIVQASAAGSSADAVAPKQADFTYDADGKRSRALYRMAVGADKPLSADFPPARQNDLTSGGASGPAAAGVETRLGESAGLIKRSPRRGERS